MDKWKLIMAAAISSGFTGATVAELKTWAFGVGAETITIKGGEIIKVGDLDSVYAKRKALTITLDDDGIEGDPTIIDNRVSSKADPSPSDADVDPELDDPNNKDPAAVKRMAARKARQKNQDAGMWASAIAGDEQEDPMRFKARGGNSAERTRNIGETRRYNRFAANGQTMFPDADSAEAVTAKRRLSMAGEKNYSQKMRDKEITDYWKKAGGIYDGTLGGVLLPTGYATEQIRVVTGYGTARDAVGGIYPMQRTKEFISRFGSSVSFGLSKEGVASDETNPTFNGVMLDSKEVSGLIILPNRLLDHSAISIADVLSTDVENSKKKYEDRAFWRGVNDKDGLVDWEGIEQKVGLNTSHTVVGLSSIVGISLTDALEWTATLPDEADQFENDIAIYCHRSVDELIFQRFVGTAGGAAETDITQKPRRTFNGNPIKHVNVLPRSTWSSGTTYAYIGPMNRAAKIGQVNGTEQYMESNHRFMDKRQWAAVISFEVAINCHNANDNDAAAVAAGSPESLIRGLRATS